MFPEIDKASEIRNTVIPVTGIPKIIKTNPLG